jgi:hypothetical protein
LRYSHKSWFPIIQPAEGGYQASGRRTETDGFFPQNPAVFPGVGKYSPANRDLYKKIRQ